MNNAAKLILIVPVIGLAALFAAAKDQSLTGITRSLPWACIIPIAIFFFIVFLILLVGNRTSGDDWEAIESVRQKVYIEVYNIPGVGAGLFANNKTFIIRKTAAKDTIAIHEVDGNNVVGRPTYVHRKDAAGTIQRKIRER